MGKNKEKGGAKEDRKAKKAELNREREKGRRRRQVNLDSGEVASFAKILLADGFELKEVGRDGNCFFRSLCDQLEGHEHEHEGYRSRVMEYVAKHEDEFSPFLSFGEGDEEEDKDFESYIERMRTDSEWAGQVELIAAAQALAVHIVRATPSCCSSMRLSLNTFDGTVCSVRGRWCISTSTPHIASSAGRRCAPARSRRRRLATSTCRIMTASTITRCDRCGVQASRRTDQAAAGAAAAPATASAPWATPAWPVARRAMRRRRAMPG